MRLWQLVGTLIIRPVEALENDFPRYLGTDGARWKVVGLYAFVTLLGVAGLGAVAVREGAPMAPSGAANVAAVALGQVLAALLSLVVSAMALSGLNIITGRGVNFLTDTVDLCVGFSLIYGTIAALVYPLELLLSLTPFVSLLILLVFAQAFWRLGLSVVLVSIAYDYEWPLALIVLLVANGIASGLLVA